MKHRSYRLLPFIAVLCMLSGFAYQTKEEELTDKKTQINELALLKDRIANIIKEHKVPGVGIALINKDGVIWAGGIGKADIKNNIPVTKDTHFRVGSITKCFVVLGLLRLIKEGKIDLNDKVRDIAPEIEINNPWQDTHPVRIVHLLEHTAGFDEMHPNEFYNIYTPDMPLLDVLKINPRSRNVRWQPGTRMAYSNPGYVVAGYLIEKITGKTFEDYLKQEVLDPLNMPTTTFKLTQASKKLLAKGYYPHRPKEIPYQEMYTRPAGSMHTSVQELANFLHLLLHRGRFGNKQLWDPESIDRMETPVSSLAAQKGLKNCYGLGNYVKQYSLPNKEYSFKTYGHNGGLDDFVSTCRYCKDLNLGFAICINNTDISCLNKLIKVVLEYLTRNCPVPKAASVSLDANILKQFEGFYVKANFRDQLLAYKERLLEFTHVYLKDGTLYQSRFSEKPKKLIPVGGNLFRMEHECDATILFTKDAEGKKVMIGNEGWLYAQEENKWIHYIKLYSLLVALLLMATYLLFMFVWVMAYCLGRLKPNTFFLLDRWLTFFAIGALFASNYLFKHTFDTIDACTINYKTIMVFILSILFASFSIFSLYFTFAHLSRYKKSLKIYFILVSLACVGITLYLTWFNMIGLRLWAW